MMTGVCGFKALKDTLRLVLRCVLAPTLSVKQTELEKLALPKDLIMIFTSSNGLWDEPFFFLGR